MVDSNRVLVRAPSNIAIVKYMGKRDFTKNLPANSSLSMTLSELCTYVEIRQAEGQTPSSTFVAEKPDGSKGEVPTLNDRGREKFLRHFERCRARAREILFAHDLAVSESRLGSAAVIRTTNTFPLEAGIASSASSFSALTLGALYYFSGDRDSFKSRYAEKRELRRSLAQISREGSGSSCRSFEGPFVAWTLDEATRVESLLPPLSDLVVVVSGERKSVGSSDAHRRVETSPHWKGRVERAEMRFRVLTLALGSGVFSKVAEIAEADFQDMHQLFETSEPSFSYFASGTDEVLEFLTKCCNQDSVLPFAVTMDAGPNVHILVPQAAEEFWREKISAQFPRFPILVDRQGTGAEILL